MVSYGIIPKAGSIVCSERVGSSSVISQPGATGLLQKSRNVVDVGEMLFQEFPHKLFVFKTLDLYIF